MGEQLNETKNWLSLKWFQRSTLENFTWENEYFFYLFLFIPLLFLLRWLIYYRGGQKLSIALSKTDVTLSLIHI